jgi:dipeptidyl-peptidase-4
METAPPPPAASKLTLNDVVGYPRPGYDVPELYAFSPDDGLVTSLCAPERGTSSRNLYAFDTATWTTKLLCTPPPTRLHFEGDDESGYSAPEAMQRERARETGKGLTSYEWASSSHRADHRASPSSSTSSSSSSHARSSIMRLLISQTYGAYVQDVFNGSGVQGGDLRLVARSAEGSPVLDAKISPDGAREETPAPPRPLASAPLVP